MPRREARGIIASPVVSDEAKADAFEVGIAEPWGRYCDSLKDGPSSHLGRSSFAQHDCAAFSCRCGGGEPAVAEGLFCIGIAESKEIR